MEDRPLRHQQLFDRFDLHRSTVLPRVGSVAAVLAIAAVGWWLLRPSSPPVESVIPVASTVAPSPPPSAPTTTAVGEQRLVVAAAGAIAEPGVYRLPAGARVQDLIEASGGFGEGADRDRVNLAAPVHDGERIWVPGRGEEDVPVVVAGSGGGASTGATDGAPDAVALVDLNAATAAELEELPGVGPATAASILAHRREVGRFGAVDELLDVRGIGEAKLGQIRPLVTV